MKIRTLREFSGVPKGTEGEAEKDGKTWKVTWNLTRDFLGTPRHKPLVDWFTQDELDSFLEKL